MNTTLETTALADALHWRYATKKMNGQPVPAEKLHYILEAARLAPSSSGLQPYRIIVVRDRELLAKIQPIAFNQSQITDCSELLIWAAQTSYTEAGTGAILKGSAVERGLPEASVDEYHQRLWGMYKNQSSDEHFAHTSKQAYISLGLAIAAAAEQQVDATPMEGFNGAALDSLLGLDAEGLKSIVILPIGYRDPENDWLVNLKKIRTPSETFVTYL
ncbi:MAG: NAD(P)H-dependent oxidoreductase [Sphingobacteriales bacterium]|nr:MAG: NAD(P)H-dependent oxidoreductase [Sphingobacteriales bacterium]